MWILTRACLCVCFWNFYKTSNFLFVPIMHVGFLDGRYKDTYVYIKINYIVILKLQFDCTNVKSTVLTIFWKLFDFLNVKFAKICLMKSFVMINIIFSWYSHSALLLFSCSLSVSGFSITITKWVRILQYILQLVQKIIVILRYLHNCFGVISTLQFKFDFTKHFNTVISLTPVFLEIHRFFHGPK